MTPAEVIAAETKARRLHLQGDLAWDRGERGEAERLHKRGHETATATCAAAGHGEVVETISRGVVTKRACARCGAPL